MRGKNTIIINGQAYDAISGRPVAISSTNLERNSGGVPQRQQRNKVISDFAPAKPMAAPRNDAVAKKPAPTTERRAQAAPAVHRKPQKSQTLLRQATKKPMPVIKAEPVAAATAAAPSRSPMITKFAPHPVVTPAKPATVVQTKQTTSAKAVAAAPIAPAPLKPAARPAQDSKLLKEQLIKERLDEVNQPLKKNKKGFSLLPKKPRTLHVASMCMALVLLGGYLTYINMPNLSVQVASARSGVAASFPEYRPDGYHFSGPIAYSPGEVTLRFKSNTSNLGYKVLQRASNWDSQAVLDNFVTKESESYLTYSEQGLTIYTYKNKAAWVNGGVLYTIDGDAPLSSEQVLRIAASL